MTFKLKLKGRHLALGAAILAALAALAWAFAPRPVLVEAAAVSRGAFEAGIEEDGQTRLRDRYTVSAPVSARMARISLREGDPVAAGDAVALLTPVMSSLQDVRSTREAQAHLRAAEAGVALAQARIQRARVTREEAQLELHRTERLAGEGFLPPARRDAARLALEAASRELEAARAQHEVAVHERAQAAAVLQPASASGAEGNAVVVRAPVAGVVLDVAQQSEGSIAAGAPLLDIGDPAHMEVVAPLLTTDAVQARPGTRVVIERWGGPPAQGRVRRVEPAAFTKVSALGIEEQRVNVLIDVENPPAAWRQMGDGFRVGVRVITQSEADVVLVPVGALFPHPDGGMAVFRLEGGRALVQPVELGGRNAQLAWVRDGLQPGQMVIVYPPPSVTEGQRVQLRQP